MHKKLRLAFAEYAVATPGSVMTVLLPVVGAQILEAADDPLHRIRTMELPSYSPAKPGDRSSFDAGNTSSSRSFRSSGPVAPQAVRPTVAPQPVRRPVSPSRAGPPKPAQVDPEQAAMRITAGPSASASSRASKASETAEV